MTTARGGVPRATQVAFLNQVDTDGKPIGIMPAVVLVPTALSAMSTMLYKSLEIRDTTVDKKYPIANPHADKFRCGVGVSPANVSRYLSNTYYTGHSDKAWYLLADPTDLPVIEVGVVWASCPRTARSRRPTSSRAGRRRYLQRAGHPDVRLPRLWRGAPGAPRQREDGPVHLARRRRVSDGVIDPPGTLRTLLPGPR